MKKKVKNYYNNLNQVIFLVNINFLLDLHQKHKQKVKDLQKYLNLLVKIYYHYLIIIKKIFKDFIILKIILYSIQIIK